MQAGWPSFKDAKSTPMKAMLMTLLLSMSLPVLAAGGGGARAGGGHNGACHNDTAQPVAPPVAAQGAATAGTINNAGAIEPIASKPAEPKPACASASH